MEGVEQFARLGRPGGTVEILPQFLDGVGVHPSMLANVKRMQVKAESANFPKERIDVGS